MPTVRIPLVGSHNQRGINAEDVVTAGKDQRFVNVIFNVALNPVTGESTVYVERRPGWGVASLVSAGNVSTGFIRSDTMGSIISAFGDTNSEIFDSTNSVGTITGRALHFSETIVNGVGFVLIKSSDGTGWYYPSDSRAVTAYTADGNNSTTITDIKISGVNSTAGLYPGQLLTAGANIVAGTRIVSVNSGAFTAVLDTATIGGAFNDLAITKTPVAKITSANFVTTGTTFSAFVEMDGFIFYVNSDGFLYHSNVNSITAFNATDKIAVNMSPDVPLAVARHKNTILVFSNNSVETFYNAGNEVGSVLARTPQNFIYVGAQNQRSIARLEDDLYFVTSSRSGDTQVMRIRGGSPQKVSTPTIDKLIGTQSATGGDIYLSGFQLGGQSYVAAFCTLSAEGPDSFLLLENNDNILLESGDDILLEGNPSQTSSFGRHLIYNSGINIWAEWSSALPTFIAGMGQSSVNQIIAASRVNSGGKIYVINPASDGELYTDDGAAFTMTIQTAKLNMGTNKRKTVREVRLVTDMQTAGTATLSVCDDDTGTYVTKGTFDLTQANPKVSRVGSHKGGRSYKIEHSFAGPFRAQAVEIDYEVSVA